MKNSTVVLLSVLLSTLVLPLTLTGASVALPEIGADLHADLAGVQWVVNGYNATFASCMLVTGSLADLLGRRRMYAVGVAVFTVGGVLSTVVGGILLLDVLRALSGVGAAAAATSGAAILADTFQGRARARVFGLFGTVLGAGLAFGPSVAGMLIELFGWRAVFGVPALVGLVVLATVPAMPRVPAPGGGDVDWAGGALFTGALLALIFVFVQGPALGWGAPVWVAAVGSVLMFGLFARVQRRRSEPMFDLGLLVNPRFLGICLAAAAIVAVLVPLLVYLPSYLSAVAGYSPGVAGTTMILLTAPTLVLPMLGGALTRRVPPGAVVVCSVVVVGAGAAWLTRIGPDAGPLALAGPLLTMGTGVGLSLGLLDALAVGSVEPARAGTASGMINTARLVSETVAIAVVGAVLATTTGGLLAGSGFTTGLRRVLWAQAVLAVLGAAATVLLLRRSRRAAADVANR